MLVVGITFGGHGGRRCRGTDAGRRSGATRDRAAGCASRSREASCAEAGRTSGGGRAAGGDGSALLHLCLPAHHGTLLLYRRSLSPGGRAGSHGRICPNYSICLLSADILLRLLSAGILLR